jgi:hypothetical protein
MALHNGVRHNNESAATVLTQLVAADGASGGFLKDSDIAALASGFLYGCTLSNNGSDATNDIDIAAGKCIDSTNAVMMTLSALTKRLDANWAAGTNQGMRNSGAAITDTTYHIYAVCKADGADPDIYAHASATVATVITALQAETGGSAYAYARRIGSIIRASATIVAFKQRGDEFLLDVALREVNDDNPGVSAVLRTLTVPGGINVDAIITAGVYDTTPAVLVQLLVSSPDITDSAADVRYTAAVANAGAGVPQFGTSTARVRTNTSSQIRTRIDASTADTFVQIVTHGWIDTRGRPG